MEKAYCLEQSENEPRKEGTGGSFVGKAASFFKGLAISRRKEGVSGTPSPPSVMLRRPRYERFCKDI